MNGVFIPSRRLGTLDSMSLVSKKSKPANIPKNVKKTPKVEAKLAEFISTYGFLAISSLNLKYSLIKNTDIMQMQIAVIIIP